MHFLFCFMRGPFLFARPFHQPLHDQRGHTESVYWRISCTSNINNTKRMNNRMRHFLRKDWREKSIWEQLTVPCSTSKTCRWGNIFHCFDIVDSPRRLVLGMKRYDMIDTTYGAILFVCTCNDMYLQNTNIWYKYTIHDSDRCILYDILVYFSNV